MRALRAAIPQGPRVRALLAGQRPMEMLALNAMRVLRAAGRNMNV